MARKPLSTIDWAQISVDDIFAGPINEIESSKRTHINVHEKIEHYERKSIFNFNKTRPAPPPPGTQIMLPKIGNYKPKILLSRETPKTNSAPKSPYEEVQFQNEHVNNKPPRETNHTTDRKPSSSDSFKQPHSECNTQPEEHIYNTIDMKPDYEPNNVSNNEKKVMIIGDKDVPLVLDTYFGPDDENVEADSTETSRKQSFSESNELLNTGNSFSDHNAVVNIGEVVVNPLFEDQGQNNETETKVETPRHAYKKRRAPGIPSSYVSRRRQNSQTSHGSEEDYPFIPEPDYDEEEATMNFDDVNKENRYESQKRKVLKEYEGEDFAKYMEEDDGFHEDVITWRKNIRHVRKSQSITKNPPISKSKFNNKPMVNPPKLKPIKKPQRSESQHGSMNQRHTLRNLSYADSKIGVDDRTVRSVKSTSAGGRYVKRGKERTMIVDGDSGGGGYEEFLKMRHKEDGSLESNSSGDSGLETGEDLYSNDNVFYQMQPNKVRDKKGTLWEKLTWRFKRHAQGGYRMS